MELTPENKATIDSFDLESLLRMIRFTPSGDYWFQGETGDYIMARYAELRAKDPAGHVAASKRIGWEKN